MVIDDGGDGLLVLMKQITIPMEQKVMVFMIWRAI